MSLSERDEVKYAREKLSGRRDVLDTTIEISPGMSLTSEDNFHGIFIGCVSGVQMGQTNIESVPDYSSRFLSRIAHDRPSDCFMMCINPRLPSSARGLTRSVAKPCTARASR